MAVHYLTPEEAQFQTTNFPQYVVNQGTNFPVSGLAYDGGSTDENAFWKFVATGYISGEILLYIYWYADTASTGNVVWGAQIAAMPPNGAAGDIETKSLATASTIQDQHLGTTGQRLHSCIITVSNLDSIAADDLVFVKIYRDASDTGNDDMAGDAILVHVVLSYTDA